MTCQARGCTQNQPCWVRIEASRKEQRSGEQKGRSPGRLAPHRTALVWGLQHRPSPRASEPRHGSPGLGRTAMVSSQGTGAQRKQEWDPRDRG